jgi:ketosteroid isomerase-like protein
MSGEARAMEPEDVTRLVAERLNAGDAAGVAALYEPEAVLAYPADRPTTGREAIQAVYRQMVDAGVRLASKRRCPPSGSRTWR